jgi:Holliday junction resolvase RusA-like endonuclease
MATKKKTSARKRTAKPRVASTVKAIVAARAEPAPWFTVTLPKPPSVNTMFRNITDGGVRGGKRGGRAKTDSYRRWRNAAGYIILAQRPPKNIAEYELRIALGRRKGSDLDNYAKAINDTLKAIGIIRDDHLCERLLIEWDDALASTEARIAFRALAREPVHVR